jgi:hypothetical protein
MLSKFFFYGAEEGVMFGAFGLEDGIVVGTKEGVLVGAGCRSSNLQEHALSTEEGVVVGAEDGHPSWRVGRIREATCHEAPREEGLMDVGIVEKKASEPLVCPGGRYHLATNVAASSLQLGILGLRPSI